MAEKFFVYGDRKPGDTLWAHRHHPLGMPCPALACQIALPDFPIPSTGPIGVLTEPVDYSTVVIVGDGEIRVAISNRLVGHTTLVDQPRDRLLSEKLAQETERLALYVPEKHTDFDIDHVWNVTMKG